jgi:hypothetical protein
MNKETALHDLFENSPNADTANGAAASTTTAKPATPLNGWANKQDQI